MTEDGERGPDQWACGFSSVIGDEPRTYRAGPQYTSSAFGVLAFLAILTPPRPGHRLQARLANGLPAFFADAKFLVSNSRQGILNSAHEFAVRLMQSDLRGSVGFTGGHIDRIPAKLTCHGNRFTQALAGREFLLFGKKKVLIVIHFAIVHFSRPMLVDCC